MHQIPSKANRILNIVLVCMILIVLRIWHLTVVQHDEKLAESRNPQRRVVYEPAKRGTIRDRFNIPLAVNKLQYNVAVQYNQIRQIPAIVWESDADGKRIKKYQRREYITALASLLGDELDIDAERIEDLIHAKAAHYNQIPFVIKENIGEEEYYRLKMLEKDWVGINVHCIPRRDYSKGKVAADLIGYMGSINHQEYERIIREMKSLEEFVKAVDEGEDASLPEGLASMEKVHSRLKDLQELAYTVYDSVGKGGIEGRYEHVLKGFRGKRSYYSDARGNFLRELPGTREPLSGKRVLLTISSELQEYAEQLLIENEGIRQTALSRLGPVKRTIMANKAPWIKGGAIVAMDPNTGEIIAMASHPRFDPNDFIASGFGEENQKKKSNILKWFESEGYLGAIWDQQLSLEREAFAKEKGIYVEEMMLTWPIYLDFILGKESPLKSSLLSNGTVADAVNVQRMVETLMESSPLDDAYQVFSYLFQGEEYRSNGKKMLPAQIEAMEAAFSQSPLRETVRSLEASIGSIRHVYDQVLLIDLLRLAVPANRFSDDLLDCVGTQSLSAYRDASAAMVSIHDVVRKMSKDLFHEIDFKAWRKANEKEFLKGKRNEEKTAGKYARPYIDYLDAVENELFQIFWQQHRLELITVFLKGISSDEQRANAEIQPYHLALDRWYQEIIQGAHQQIEWAEHYAILQGVIFMLPPGLDTAYLQSLRSFKDLGRPLLGRYRGLRSDSEKKQTEKHLAIAFYPKYGYGYVRSQAYRQAATQGSIFKLVTAYEALVQRYLHQQEIGGSLDDLNPLVIIDRVWRKGKDLYVGSLADGTPIPRHYKGGRMPRSISAKIGKLDVMKSLEMSSNPYFALLAGDILHSPDDLAEAARQFSYGSRTGIDLPGEIAGNIPNDLHKNRTGLYAFAIGQHTLVATPLQTCVMLSALSNGGKVLKPKIVSMLVGKEPQRGQDLMAGNSHFPFQESLELVGIDFPLFIMGNSKGASSLVKKVPTQVVRTVFMPMEIRRILLDSMCRVMERTQHEGLAGLSKLYRSSPETISDYVEMRKQFIGKTSTSESVENIDLDQDQGTNLYTHVWFGGISYEMDILDENAHRFLFRDSAGSPELVVVVYLRYGGYGKEAAPVASQIAKKWKEIKNRMKKDED